MKDEGIDAAEGSSIKGSVMVIGAGISGIQSSLDLADSGFKVYLVDRGLSIGGTMAQLDKTFPTNDCSMCILAPKLVYTGRHRNIEIITKSEVKKIKGEVGNFQVTLMKHPRFVDMDLCNGCGDCVEHCPVSILSDYNEGLDLRKAIYQPFPQAIPNVFAIDRSTERAPCRIECPAGLNAQGFIALASEEKFAEAYVLIKEKMPLPGSLGRICYHPCETECNRKEVDEPISICNIRRFIADHIYKHPEALEEYIKRRDENLSKIENRVEVKGRGHERRIAIVGAGPAGLTAAVDLKNMGYLPTIYEANETCGGMMHQGIPAYRLNKDYLKREIDLLIDENDLRIESSKALGKDFHLSDLKERGHEAVFLGLGAPTSRSLDIPGIESGGVDHGIEFLKGVTDGRYGKEHLKGEEVIVIGGGNVAIDVARSSVRLGASGVNIVCLESEREMPAHRWEIEEAIGEGVLVHTSLGPDRILSDGGKVTGLECVKCLSVFDERKRFSPKFDRECSRTLPGTKLIIAIGQGPDTQFLGDEGVELDPSGWIKVDKTTLQTSLEWVFAGGDVASGPASAVEAIGAGHEAAISIDRYLNGDDLSEGREARKEEGAPIPESSTRVPRDRERAPSISPDRRRTTFEEVEGTFDLEAVVNEARRCLNCGGCSECMQCVEHCQRGAIDHNMTEVTEELNVGAVILSPGFDEYVPPTGDSLGYRVYPNVLTSIEFERMLSASGPYKGHVKRISDGETPKKIAWLQCVGSRDESCDHPYCSSVCCMYATKEAVIAKEHLSGDLETHIYFMDHRSFGKDFDRYYERSKEEYGVVYRRSRVPRVEQDRETKDLIIRYVDDDGKVRKERYDMVVLSVGIQPCETLGDLSSALDINLNRYGFIETDAYTPVETSREGVYASGTVTEPKDIPESVTQASAAAADAAKDITSARGTEVVEKSYPSERDVMSEVPRIGVFVCHCGINIGGVIDVPGVVEYAKALPYVVLSDDNLFTCSQDSQERVKEKIVELGLNRVVIASCTPRTHEPLFQDTLREAGLNPHLFEMANLRDQNSWVHRDDPDRATEKAKDLVRMAVMKAAELFSVSHTRIPVNHDALVIGGGIAGMTAALSLGDQGFRTYLVERENELGGHLRQIHLGVSGEDPQKLLKDTVERVTTHPNIKVYAGTRIEEIGGYVGNFDSNLKVEGTAENVLISHGAVIVATGALPYEPTEYGYGQNDNVLTQTDLETMLAAGGESLEDVKEMVMIQCIGSRNEEHPYCSRVCCSNAIKNALKLREVDPSATIYILYRDIRTYGYREDTLYRKAREKGIIFLRFEEGDDPVMEEKEGKMTITLKERVLGRDIILHPDKLVLSRGIVPQDNTDLSRQLKVPLNSDSFFSEAHVKLRPVDFSADGIFLCGMAHSPRFIEEAIIQAKATAARAVTILSRESLETLGNISHVNPRYCAGCRMCIDVCPYDAIDFDQEKRIAVVNEILCQGCGACATACPGGVSQQNTFTKRQVFAMIDSFMEG